MTPRDDNPALFRENVYKSWKVMAHVVKHIDGQSWIAHLEPNPGVGYDCLSLVIKDSDGRIQIPFMMNRNGVNSSRLDKIWAKVADEGHVPVAEELIEACHLPRSSVPRDTGVTRVCNRVVEWIGQHVDLDFYVGPLHWPGCCITRLNIPITDPQSVGWPIPDHGPDISLGIDRVEVERLVQRRHIEDWNESSETEKDKRLKSFEESTDYTDLGQALAAWKPLQDRSHVWEEIETVIKKVSDSLGMIIRVHIPPAQTYVAVTFSGEPKKVGAYIAVGYVNHIVDIAGSFPSEVDPGYWRSNLSTSGATPGPSSPKSASNLVTCPTCHEQISRYAECRCGWRATGA